MRYLIPILLVLFVVGLVSAQESPYEIALQRIEYAERTNSPELDLSSLGLTEVPPEVGNLTNLTILNLYNNQLSDLPDELENLQNLRVLFLNSNAFSSLPIVVTELENLRWLSVMDNQLLGLPPQMGDMSRLCLLNISENDIRTLPNELGQLTRLGELSRCNEDTGGLLLEGNPLLSPPDEVIAQGIPAILAYLRHQAWWHLQSLIVASMSSLGLLSAAFLLLRYRHNRRKGKRKNEEVLA